MKAQSVIARATSDCEVCGQKKVKGVHKLFLWVPDEPMCYDKVWVHFRCWKRLLDGERPPGVKRKETNLAPS